MVIYRPNVSSLLTVHKGTWLQEDILLMYVSNILSHSKSNWYSSPTKRLMSVQAMRFSINSIYFHYLNCTEGNRSVIITPWAVNSQTNLCIKMFLSRGKKVLIQWDYHSITGYFRPSVKDCHTLKPCTKIIEFARRFAPSDQLCVCLFVSIFKSLRLPLRVEKDKQGRIYWFVDPNCTKL